MLFRAELDACYARLYSLTRDELRYTPFGVDPKEVHGETLRYALSGTQGKFP